MSQDTSEPLHTNTPDKIIGVLLVDDHAVVRQGLRMFIEMQSDMQVLGEGCNGLEAVELSARLSQILSFVMHLGPASQTILAAIEALLLGVTLPVVDGFLVRKEAQRSIPSR